jgi:hypothetical protein
MIKEHVNVILVGSCVTSMIMYKTVVILWMKSAYSQQASILDPIRGSLRAREIAFFMMVGAPLIVGNLMVINKVTSAGTKVNLSLAAKNDLVVPNTASSSCSVSFFLFLNF